MKTKITFDVDLHTIYYTALKIALKHPRSYKNKLTKNKIMWMVRYLCKTYGMYFYTEPSTYLEIPQETYSNIDLLFDVFDIVKKEFNQEFQQNEFNQFSKSLNEYKDV